MHTNSQEWLSNCPLHIFKDLYCSIGYVPYALSSVSALTSSAVCNTLYFLHANTHRTTTCLKKVAKLICINSKIFVMIVSVRILAPCYVHFEKKVKKYANIFSFNIFAQKPTMEFSTITQLRQINPATTFFMRQAGIRGLLIVNLFHILHISMTTMLHKLSTAKILKLN